MAQALRIRRSLYDLQYDYEKGGNKKPLEDLMRAWQGIKALPPQDPRSFFVLGGYHGEPFLSESDLEVEVRTRDGVLTAVTAQALTPEPAKKPFRVEVVTADDESPAPPEPVTA